MENWAPEKSTFLSKLLDEVVGTQEMVDTRQDFCKLFDCIKSSGGNPIYFTGSKAEGLDLPGSDRDFMLTINNIFKIKVKQSLQERHTTSRSANIFYLCTENVEPCFALLRFANRIKHPILLDSSRYINGVPHLSSWHLVEDAYQYLRHGLDPRTKETFARQGPSVETWTLYDDKSKSGTDKVICIRCHFWPKGAVEWKRRPRHFQWPTERDISYIVNFGCHLVPIGHPLSTQKEMEWRISFSVAEKALVWSFNHVQMQCYAVMKIILKEFIKPNCSRENGVLCSYFIKTFLFWEYESVDVGFWCTDNFRECVRYLFIEFRECLRKGEIRHYFFRKFNLLSIKLKPEFQTELLRLFDIIIQRDVAIFKECRTLSSIWSKFEANKGKDNINMMNVLRNLRRTNLIGNDKCMMDMFTLLFDQLVDSPIDNIAAAVTEVEETLCKTSLKSLAIKFLFSVTNFFHCTTIKYSENKNKDVYKVNQLSTSSRFSFDISTSKLWYAMMLLKKEDYESCISMAKEVLSEIPPHALYMSHHGLCGGRELEKMYIDMTLDSNLCTTDKARTSWLYDLRFSENENNGCNIGILPLAIQLEMKFAYFSKVCVSPFVFAYYLMFLCYDVLQQYDDRQRALKQLLDVVKRPQQRSNMSHFSFNIAGHCLIRAGEYMRAMDMFVESIWSNARQFGPRLAEYNTALYYLRDLHTCGLTHPIAGDVRNILEELEMRNLYGT